MLFENPVPFNLHLRITTQQHNLVLKMAGISTKHIWQPYLQNISVP